MAEPQPARAETPPLGILIVPSPPSTFVTSRPRHGPEGLELAPEQLPLGCVEIHTFIDQGCPQGSRRGLAL